jgi:hypothetical protein
MSRPKRVVSEQEIKEISSAYLAGTSINNLQKQTKLQKRVLKKLLNEAGIRVLSSYETQVKNATPIDVDCLNAKTDLSAYVLGLIFGDGHVHYDELKYKYSVSLISVDCDILTSAQTLFGKDFPIHTIFPKKKKRKTTYNIVMNSKEFAIHLRKTYGFINRKSDCLIWPNLPSEMYQYFISGLLSTDGCIRVDSRRKNKAYGIEFSYSSNCLDFIEKLRSHLCKTLNIKEEGHIKVLKKNKKRKNPNYSLRYTGTSAAKILDWIYQNTNPLTRCKRKYDIYQNHLLACVSNSII